MEKVTDKAKREFTDLREESGACPTFTAVTPGEQLQIERIVFNVKPIEREIDYS